MNRRTILASMLNLAGGAAALSSGVAAAAVKPRPGPRAGYFPNFVLTTHEGKSVRFYDDLMRGKTVMVNFMYTHCGGICPTQTANLVKVQRQLGARVGRDIFMYSITLEPWIDKPEVLNRYAQGFRVGPGWLFLTGKTSEIETIRRAVGFVDPDPQLDRERTSHIGVVLYGIESLDRWAMYPALGRPEVLAHNVVALSGERPWSPLFRKTVPPAPRQAG